MVLVPTVISHRFGLRLKCCQTMVLWCVASIFPGMAHLQDWQHTSQARTTSCLTVF